MLLFWVALVLREFSVQMLQYFTAMLTIAKVFANAGSNP